MPKTRGRPRKSDKLPEVVSVEESKKKNFDKPVLGNSVPIPPESIETIVLKRFGEFNNKVSSLEQRLQKLESHVNNIYAMPTEPPRTREEEASVVKTKEKDSGIIKEVENILGTGFDVTTESIDNKFFRLQIIPPKHLRPEIDDKRSAVIEHLKGKDDAVLYATTVKEYCTNWAQRNGVTY